MQLLGMSIDRIVIHQVYQREADGNKSPPLQSHDFTRFDSSAMEEFKSRVRDALGDGSKAVQMSIVNQDLGDTPTVVRECISSDDNTFLAKSYEIAKNLNNAQQRRSIPGGIVVIFTGTQGPHKKRFLGIIKAEIHSAYEKQLNPTTKEISLKFVQEVLLTPGTRLYKTAAFFEIDGGDTSTGDLNDIMSVMISDYQISQTDGKAAAQYFYSDFLGCGYPETSARTTKRFYDAAIQFISDLDETAEAKCDLYNALTTYLKVNTSSTISPSDFAASYFDIDTQDTFTEHLRECDVPTTAFTKDTIYIQSKLKFRRISFNQNIKLSAPPEAFKNTITLETIEGDPDESGAPQVWTKIIVKDTVLSQE